ncbi:DUF3558 domain-containing protein [Amycolatopsis sp. NBC_00345]|uniref:DUF3558 family protein n=1 Tax=Amycolatopsis sp. NBC_00345 TaxID=2975955 RepID=UPI002E2731D9
MRRAMVTAVVLACGLGLSACNDDPPGLSSPATRAGGTTAAPTGGSGKTGTPLAGTDPCTLLKPADVPELKQDSDTTPERRTDLHPLCAGDDYSVTIIDNDQAGHEMDFEGSLAKPAPDIAGHHAVTAVMQVGASQSCLVFVEVTADEYVRVGTTAHDDDPATMCGIAVRAATVVASRIPA